MMEILEAYSVNIVLYLNILINTLKYNNIRTYHIQNEM